MDIFSLVMLQDTTLTFGNSCRPLLFSQILTDTECSAEIFAANLFQITFSQNPRSRAAWDRFRHRILEYGRSRNKLEIVEELLGGHPTNPSELLIMLGMSVSTT